MTYLLRSCVMLLALLAVLAACAPTPPVPYVPPPVANGGPRYPTQIPRIELGGSDAVMTMRLPGKIDGTRIDHVGMLVGDLDGDGAWDMVHASAPCCGVRIEYGLFESTYYRPRIAGFRTAR